MKIKTKPKKKKERQQGKAQKNYPRKSPFVFLRKAASATYIFNYIFYSMLLSSCSKISTKTKKKTIIYIYNSSILSFLSFCFLFIFLTEEFLTLDKMVNIQMETNHSLVVVLKNEHNTYKYLYKF